jgi:hypothetical protein
MMGPQLLLYLARENPRSRSALAQFTRLEYGEEPGLGTPYRASARPVARRSTSGLFRRIFRRSDAPSAPLATPITASAVLLETTCESGSQILTVHP